jgi:hypothetical protein
MALPMKRNCLMNVYVSTACSGCMVITLMGNKEINNMAKKCDSKSMKDKKVSKPMQGMAKGGVTKAAPRGR